MGLVLIVQDDVSREEPVRGVIFVKISAVTHYFRLDGNDYGTIGTAGKNK